MALLLVGKRCRLYVAMGDIRALHMLKRIPLLIFSPTGGVFLEILRAVRVFVIAFQHYRYYEHFRSLSNYDVVARVW